MLRQSPRRNQRSKGMKVKHVLQGSLVLGVCIWLVLYQMPDDQSSSHHGIKLSQKLRNANDIKLGRKDLKPRTTTQVEIEDEKQNEAKTDGDDDKETVVEENGKQHKQDSAEDANKSKHVESGDAAEENESKENQSEETKEEGGEKKQLESSSKEGEANQRKNGTKEENHHGTESGIGPNSQTVAETEKLSLGDVNLMSGSSKGSPRSSEDYYSSPRTTESPLAALKNKIWN